VNRLFFAAASAAVLSMSAQADDAYNARVDDHAPIGVMGDHFHKKGEYMASLRAMWMDMGSPLNTASGPQSMSKSMYMAGMMYAPSDKVTLAASLKYVDSEMDMLMMGRKMESGADDIGDAGFSAIIPVYTHHDRRLLVRLGASIPIGATDKLDAAGSRLGLGLQSGTGSWGFTPSVTYSQFLDGWSYGVQANASIWLDDNEFGERVGDTLGLTSWAAVQVKDAISISTRVAYTDTAATTGLMMPSMGDARQTFTGYAGINTLVKGHRFAIEAGVPLWQDQGLNTLKSEFSLMLGWQKAF